MSTGIWTWVLVLTEQTLSALSHLPSLTLAFTLDQTGASGESEQRVARA